MDVIESGELRDYDQKGAQERGEDDRRGGDSAAPENG